MSTSEEIPVEKPKQKTAGDMLQDLLDNEPLCDELVKIFYKKEDDTYRISDEGNFIGRYFEAGGKPGSLFSALGMHVERQLHRGPEEESKPTADPKLLEDRYKLIFYVPQSHLEAVKEAVFAAGAGTFPGGKYEKCCFESIGTGQFLPVAEKGANPTIGEKEEGKEEFRLERVLEVRCEVLCCGRECLVRSVEGLRKAHPYEEPAYEAYKMEAL